jgi:hypothetical protein
VRAGASEQTSTRRSCPSVGSSSTWTPGVKCPHHIIASSHVSGRAQRGNFLAQRIVLRRHLSGLTREERIKYMAHRLRLAYCALVMFEPPGDRSPFPGHTPGRFPQGQPCTLCADHRRHRTRPTALPPTMSNPPRGGSPMANRPSVPTSTGPLTGLRNRPWRWLSRSFSLQVRAQ